DPRSGDPGRGAPNLPARRRRVPDRDLRHPAGADHDLLPARHRPGCARPAPRRCRARARRGDPRRRGGTGRRGPGVTSILRVENLTRRFGGLTAVHAVDFSVAPREIVAIIGPNGAGKTTLFNLITGFVPPTSGHIYYREEPITGLAA